MVGSRVAGSAIKESPRSSDFALCVRSVFLFKLGGLVSFGPDLRSFGGNGLFRLQLKLLEFKHRLCLGGRLLLSSMPKGWLARPQGEVSSV